jgi:hypothetical protein
VRGASFSIKLGEEENIRPSVCRKKQASDSGCVGPDAGDELRISRLVLLILAGLEYLVCG